MKMGKRFGCLLNEKVYQILGIIIIIIIIIIFKWG